MFFKQTEMSSLPSSSSVIELQEIVTSEESCSNETQHFLLNGQECPPSFDDFLCWVNVPRSTVAKVSCSQIFAVMGLEPTVATDEQFALRTCDDSGQWSPSDWTNYTSCLDLLPNNSEDDSAAYATSRVRHLVAHLLLLGSLISLVLLLVSLYIFFHFKTLTCTRFRVHRNLVIALILHSGLLAIISVPAVVPVAAAMSTLWPKACKMILCLKMYASMAAVNWMFVEGVVLHTKLARVFRKDLNFLWYHFIGWGMPALVMVLWVTAMEWTLGNSNCWRGYSKSAFVWLVTGPMFAALIANSFFLVNIVRILLTKIENSVSHEVMQVEREASLSFLCDGLKRESWRDANLIPDFRTLSNSFPQMYFLAQMSRTAAKATGLLFPLLGVNNLLFCVNPRDDDQLEDAYLVLNAIFQSSQGILVAILYCLTNSEVKAAVNVAYKRRLTLWQLNSSASNPNNVAEQV